MAYDGGAYSGWQVQPATLTVQGAIEGVLERMTQRPCRLRAAGRTDAGVHAAGQLACFQTESTLSAYRFLRGLNGLLPDDIIIREVVEVAAGFDPRRHNQGKHYRYVLWHAPMIPPDVRHRAYHRPGPLDLARMAAAAERLVGTHDFAAFRSASCERETTVRTLYRCTVNDRRPEVWIDVEGTAFLKNMVRIIAGTLLGIGSGKLPVARVDELLAAGDRSRGGVTAPAHALCMMRVFL